jgi:hypothetical protein
MLQSPSHQGMTGGYEREVPTREVVLFVALLALPFALLVVPVLFAD